MVVAAIPEMKHQRRTLVRAGLDKPQLHYFYLNLAAFVSHMKMFLLSPLVYLTFSKVIMFTHCLFGRQKVRAKTYNSGLATTAVDHLLTYSTLLADIGRNKLILEGFKAPNKTTSSQIQYIHHSSIHTQRISTSKSII